MQSGNRTEGHRFLGKANIPLAGPDDYDPKLKKNFVLSQPGGAPKEDRERDSVARVHAKGLRAHEDAGLLELVTYLNEYPTVILGDFDPAFLELPDEILITVMRGHQKYFALESRNGELAPHFLAVINLAARPEGARAAGHERVLRARFADARFFWETDQKCKLGDYLPKLAAVTYESPPRQL